jgi:hypothetical protein
MMKSLGGELAEPLDRPMARRILIQGTDAFGVRCNSRYRRQGFDADGHAVGDIEYQWQRRADPHVILAELELP